MNIPSSLLSKMGNYEIEVKGVKVKVSVVDNSDVLDLYIAELSSSLEKSSATPLLAFDLKVGSYSKLESPLLILCIRSRCLLVDWRCMNPVPQFLENFLDNKNVCFVGMEEVISKLQKWPVECNHFYRAVKLGHLAARVLKNPNLEWLGTLAELAAAVGLRYKEPKNGHFSGWSVSTVFSKEEVEYAIHDAYICCIYGCREAFEVALGL